MRGHPDRSSPILFNISPACDLVAEAKGNLNRNLAHYATVISPGAMSHCRMGHRQHDW
jgi:hypothetical protein